MGRRRMWSRRCSRGLRADTTERFGGVWPAPSFDFQKYSGNLPNIQSVGNTEVFAWAEPVLDYFAQPRPSANLPATISFWTFHSARSIAATFPLALHDT
jgi:hypothetical protein